MLPKNRRIPRILYSELSRAKVFGNDLFNLRVADQKEVKSRFSVSVSKKIAKKANTRNSLRRLVYRMIYVRLNQIKDGILAQVIWKRQPKSKEEIETKLLELLNKIIK